MYVVYCHERLRDETIEFGKFFPKQEQALAYIDKMLADDFGNAWSFRLFELDKEIPLEFSEQLEQLPPKLVKKTVKVVGKDELSSVPLKHKTNERGAF